MSENGPREGTRDLPRTGPESGRRSVDPNSAAGLAYQAIARRSLRRRDELLALVRSGLTIEEAAAKYSTEHPLEHEVTPSEVAAAIAAPRRRTLPPTSNRT